ncbi:hypothetical protein FHG87_025754, partial [Trinorchestia longiramus]
EEEREREREEGRERERERRQEREREEANERDRYGQSNASQIFVKCIWCDDLK